MYVLGMLSEQEAAEVEAYAVAYPEVRQAIATYEQTLEQYAQLHALQPPEHMRERIWKTLSANASSTTHSATRSIKSRSRFFSHPIWPYLVAACVLLLIGSLILNVLFYNRYQHVQQETAQLKQQQTDLQQQLRTYATALQVLQTSHFTPIILKGVNTHPDMLATVYWNKANGEVYLLPNTLPPPPEGKQYQLWAIVNGKPISAGVYPVDSVSVPIQKMTTMSRPVQAFAITLEKRGGSPTPTLSAMYVMGKVNG